MRIMIESINYGRNTTTITFAKQWVKIKCKYVCQCGRKFTRLNSDYFTNSGVFGQKRTDAEVRAEYVERMKNEVRLCPKCKTECKPTTTP